MKNKGVRAEWLILLELLCYKALHIISWQFGGATFGMSDVPRLKGKDKLV